MSRGFVDNENVVSMQFDNREFEKNVHQSLGTIDKLKKSLDFSGSVKGMEELDSCTKDLNVNTNALTSAIGAVSNKFSAMEIAGITAISRITDRVIDLGERLVKSLTVDQLASGWSKYEEKVTAVQTIMAATASTWEENARRIGFAGTQMEYVNEQLNRLNWFSDETSYSFTDMTSNIGKFTSSGIALDQAVTAMEGISVWAAKSGQNAQSASRAYYNLAQAISVGSVKLIDWKSIENANMATIEFKQTAIDTAVALGTLKKVGDGVFETLDGHEVTVRNFNEALKDEWFTSEVLMESLEEYGKAAVRLSEISEDYGTTATFFLRGLKDWQNGNRDITDISKSVGIEVEELIPLFEELSSKEYELSLSAFTAAQEAKTFSEVLSATKDAVSTKWMNTWELIFGDYEHAKELWSNVAEEFYDIFAAPGDARNELLEQTMDSAWDQVIARINAAGIATGDFEKKLTENLRLAGIPIDALVKQYGSLGEAIRHVKDVGQHIRQTILSFTEPIAGSVEGIENATQKLDEFQKVVNQVIRGNFKSGKERVDRLTKAGYDYATVQGLVNKVWEKNNHTWKDTTITMDDLIDVMGKMSDTELESIGMTRDEVGALQALKAEVGTIGSDIDNLIKRVHKKSGKELIFLSISHAISAIKKAIDVVRGAWRDVFPAKTSEELYGFLEAIEKITEWLDANDDTLDKVRRTLRGVFSISGILRDLIVAALRVFLPGLLKGTSEVGGGLLDLTANLGDAIVELREFLKNGELLTNILGYLKEMFKEGAKNVGKVVDELIRLPVIGTIIEKIIYGLNSIYDLCIELWETFYDSIIVDGKSAFEALLSVFSKLQEKFEKLGEKYPILKDVKDAIVDFFKQAKEIGSNVLDGILDGLSFKKIEDIINGIKEIANAMIMVFKDILGIHSPSQVFFEMALQCIAGIVLGFIYGIMFVVDAVRKVATGISSAFEHAIVTDPNSPMAKLYALLTEGFTNVKIFLESFWLSIKDVVDRVKTYVNTEKIFDKFINILKQILTLVTIIGALRLLWGIGTLTKGIGEAASSISGFFDSWALKNYSAVGKNISICIGIIGTIVYLLSKLTPQQFDQAMWALGGFSALAVTLAIVMYGLSQASEAINKLKFNKQMAKAEFAKYWGIVQNASMILAIGISLWFIVQAIKDLSTMFKEDGAAFVEGLAGVVTIGFFLLQATKQLANLTAKTKGFSLIGVAGTIAVMAWAVSSLMDTMYNFFFKTNKDGKVKIDFIENAAQWLIGLVTVVALLASICGGIGLTGKLSGGTIKMFGVASAVIGITAGIYILVRSIEELGKVISEMYDKRIAKGWSDKAAFGYVLGTIALVLGGLLTLLGIVGLISIILSNDKGSAGKLIAAGVFLLLFTAALRMLITDIKYMDDVISYMKHPVGTIITTAGLLIGITKAMKVFQESSFKADWKAMITSLGGLIAVILVMGYVMDTLISNDNYNSNDIITIAATIGIAVSALMGVVGLINKFLYGGKAYDVKSSINQLIDMAGLALVIFTFGEEVAKLAEIGWDKVQPVMEGVRDTVISMFTIIELIDTLKSYLLQKSMITNVFGDFDLAALFFAMGLGLKFLAEGIAALLSAVNESGNDYGTKLTVIHNFLGAILILLGIFSTVMSAILEKMSGGAALLALIIFAIGILCGGLGVLLFAINELVKNEKLSKWFGDIKTFIEGIIEKVEELINDLLMLGDVNIIQALADSPLHWLVPLKSSEQKQREEDVQNYLDDLTRKYYSNHRDKELLDSGYLNPNKSTGRPIGPNDDVIQDHTLKVGKGFIIEAEGIQVVSSGMYVGNKSDKVTSPQPEKSTKIINVEFTPENFLNWDWNSFREGMTVFNETLDKINPLGGTGGANQSGLLWKIPEGVEGANNFIKVFEAIQNGADPLEALIGFYGGENSEAMQELLKLKNGELGALSADQFSAAYKQELIENGMDPVILDKYLNGEEVSTEDLMKMYGIDFGNAFSYSFGATLSEKIPEQIRKSIENMSTEEIVESAGAVEKIWSLVDQFLGGTNSAYDYISSGVHSIVKDITATPNYNLFGMGGLGGFGNTVVQFPEKMETTSPDVVQAIETGTAKINTGITGLYTKIAGLYVRLDTGAMVGNLTPYISREIKGYVDAMLR